MKPSGDAGSPGNCLPLRGARSTSSRLTCSIYLTWTTHWPPTCVYLHQAILWWYDTFSTDTFSLSMLRVVFSYRLEAQRGSTWGRSSSSGTEFFLAMMEEERSEVHTP